MKLKTIFLSLLILTAFCSQSQKIESLIKSSGNYDGHGAVVIFDSTYVDMEVSGLSHVKNRVLYKILTPEGAKHFNVIKFDYDPLSAYVELKSAKIYRNDGTVEELDVKKAMDYPAPARMIYWGARQLMIETGRLEPGDAVEVNVYRKGFTYALLKADDDDKYIPPMKGHFYDIVRFFGDYPIKLKYYEVLIPNGKTVLYKFYNGSVDSLINFKGEKMKYAFSKKEMMPVHGEPRSVGPDDMAPKLLISTSPNWEAKSTWFYGVNEDYGSFDNYPEMDKKVKEILVGAKDELDSISRLTHWVADNMRYSGISMGEGEGFTLHNAKMNFTDRCGVCKDKASLLIAMLRAAGFESYAAMTMAGTRIDRIPADQFNHSVTVVRRRNGEYQLLDPTWVPFVRELWSSREQQQNYLMGLPEGADLMETPISPPENHYLRFTGKSEIMANGTLNGEFVVDAEGQSDASVRSLFTRNFKERWPKVIEEELLAINPLAKIEKVEYPEDPYNHQAGPIQIKVRYSIPDYALVTEEEIIFVPLLAQNVFSAQWNLSFDTSMKERKYEFKSSCSQQVEIKETITLPAFKEKVYVPETEAVSGTGADYEGGYTVNGKVIEFSEKASYKKRVYQPADWESFRNAVAAQKKLAGEKIILKIK
ncbi:MAG TPA: transglutaminase [Bacteroidales bacterium]|nr:MAG: hypothetical protein UR43_C0011G0033 [candidate division TM6 bacterium GW2011_GWF2_33_332]HBS87736.1 transglutaminase [Bacteroidales bacterium]